MPTESPQLGVRRHDTQAFNQPTFVPYAAASGAANEHFYEPTDATRLLIAEMQNLSNDQLTRQVVQLNRKQHLVDAELLLYLGELDCRKVYRNLACSSMFDFLTARLGQSEDVAYRWMWGARLLRAFPLVYELLANGRLHLSALMLLKPHLSEENHREWLMAAAGRSKREIEKLIAARCPKPDVPARVRKLPDTVPGQNGGSGERACAGGSRSPVVPSIVAPPSAPATPSAPAGTSEPSSAVFTQPSLREPLSARLDKPSQATKIQPLSEHSYRVVFTASQRLKEKLERGGELVSHAIAPTDLPALLERALDLLIEREERRRYGSRRRRTATATATATALSPMDAVDADIQDDVPDSRHLPAGLRRQVWERDGGQCSYVDAEGRRCQSRHFLEFDHRVAHALGGAPTIDNIRMRCRAHNALAAEQVFGVERIADAIASAKEHRHRTGATSHRTG